MKKQYEKLENLIAALVEAKKEAISNQDYEMASDIRDLEKKALKHLEYLKLY